MARKQRYKAFGVALIDGPMAGKPAIWSTHVEIAGGDAVGGRFWVPAHQAVGDLIPTYEYEFTAARTARFVRELGMRSVAVSASTAFGSP